MGREIVYCEGCGQRLTQDDFDRGKAQDHDNRPFCITCRPLSEPPPPQPKERTTERRAPSGSSARRRTERIPLAQPPPRRADDGGNGNVGLWVAGGLAVLVLIVVAVAMSGRENPAPPQEAYVPPKPPPEYRPPTVDPAVERLKELESFATAVADPQAVLVRCDQLRSTFRGSPLEARFKQIEAQAQERLKEKERAAELERSLASIRKIILDDTACARRREVEALLDAAIKQAGAKSAEVQKLQSEYRTLCEEAAKRAEAEKAPPKKAWYDCFLLGTNRLQTKDVPAAKKLFLEGLATLPETRPEEFQQRAMYCVGLYNLACIYAVEAEKLPDKDRSQAIDEAFKHLDRALRGDYNRMRCSCHPQTLGYGHMTEDKDFIVLRNDPRYAAMLKKYKP